MPRILRSRPAATLLFQLALRDFRQRYAGSALGWLWSVIHPLVLLAVYTFLFETAFGARLPPEEATRSYPLFLLGGLLPWMLFSETVTRSAAALTDHSTLIKKSVFPSEALPVSILLSTAFGHLVAVGVLLAAAAALGQPPGLSLVMLPAWLVLLSMLSLGLAWSVAALQVYLRDTSQILSVILTGWFWLTPVFLPEAFYEGRLDPVLDWNPLRHAVLGYRSAILGGDLPGPFHAAALCAYSLLAFVGGGLFFRRAKKGFPDVI